MMVVCLKCLTLSDPLCSCGNVGTLIDRDGSLNIYVEDLRTARLANVFYDADHNEAYRELLEPFDTQVYVPYKEIRDTHLNFQPYTPKNNYIRQSPDTFDRKLMAVLNKYKHSMASPKRMGSTHQQPSKKEHK